MIEVISIPTFTDNYVWLIKNSQTGHCCVVDPGQAEPVLKVLQQHGLSLDAILITHHHYDHIDGTNDLIAATTLPVTIYSSIDMQLPALATNGGEVCRVDEGSQIKPLDEGLSLNVMATPGHKRDHVVYYNDELLFCGDTLFSGGCGRILDGTAEDLFNSLQRIAALGDEIAVYPAHEYTQANLAFCHAVEPQNRALKDYISRVAKLRQQGLPTLPSSIKQEKLVNVFLRSELDSVRCAMEHKEADILDSEQAVFTALRRYKDHF